MAFAFEGHLMRDTRQEVGHFRLFFVFPGYWFREIRTGCNFTLRWRLNVGNNSLEQNLRMKTLYYLPFITAIFLFSVRLTHGKLLVQRWLGAIGLLPLNECPVLLYYDRIHLDSQLQKILRPDLHPVFPKCRNTPNTQRSYAWPRGGGSRGMVNFAGGIFFVGSWVSVE